MQFSQLRKELGSIIFDTTRTDRADYFEAVLKKGELEKLNSMLIKLLGSPKPVSDKDKDLLKDFGGVWPGQTLYICNDGNVNVFAMLWPWADGDHFTVKSGEIKGGTKS
jgi:hypothetical protein